ncbi:unnamed protein product [Porites evermanni]|uniref:Uncharacterized protein n=1 Tax=Porites evermanni TaxID=104178 RepID=A0ABN8LX13_9CNID|nr:unnamed protein product [Porites evermanni]
MVFKVVGGQPGPAGYIYQLWKSNDSLNEDVTNVLGISRSFPIPYKNRLVSSWQTTKPKEARVALYKNGNEVLSIVFNATNSDKENWFSADRVTFSPWEDLTSNLRHFSHSQEIQRGHFTSQALISLAIMTLDG